MRLNNTVNTCLVISFFLLIMGPIHQLEFGRRLRLTPLHFPLPSGAPCAWYGQLIVSTKSSLSTCVMSVLWHFQGDSSSSGSCKWIVTTCFCCFLLLLPIHQLKIRPPVYLPPPPPPSPPLPPPPSLPQCKKHCSFWRNQLVFAIVTRISPWNVPRPWLLLLCFIGAASIRDSRIKGNKKELVVLGYGK